MFAAVNVRSSAAPSRDALLRGVAQPWQLDLASEIDASAAASDPPS